MFDASLDFEVDGATISLCGWQHLREFVAEYRAMFASPVAEITVLGFTDTTGTEAHNLQLSQRRADNVKQALHEIAGPSLGVSPERFHAVGLGETPARTIGNLPDGFDASEWRRVHVIVNELVSVDIDSPRSAQPVP